MSPRKTYTDPFASPTASTICGQFSSWTASTVIGASGCFGVKRREDFSKGGVAVLDFACPSRFHTFRMAETGALSWPTVISRACFCKHAGLCHVT